MYKSLYEKDFNVTSKKEFDFLLSTGKDVISIGILEENTFEGIQKYGTQRDTQYKAVGRKICEHSDILLSLYDGVDNGLTGGTSETIKYYLENKKYPLLYNLKVDRGNNSKQKELIVINFKRMKIIDFN